MKNLTHFKINNVEEIEKILTNFKDQFDENITFESMRKDFLDGENILQCNTFGVIYLNFEPIHGSKEIKNLFSSSNEIKTNGHSDLEESKDIRRIRIDAVLKFIEFDIENEYLEKLIKVIDLINENEGDARIDDILKIKDL